MKKQVKSQASLAGSVDEMLASGEGFSDRGFKSTCHRCLAPITHDILAAAKFCADVKRLLRYRIPMPGTILNTRGYAFTYDIHKSDASGGGPYHRVNKLLSFGLGQRILDQPRLGGEGSNESISRIRDMIDMVIADDHKYMRRVMGSDSCQMTRVERDGYRKMMSRYWENPSPFAVDLVGIVVRQGTFVEKMHDVDWLHSPALPVTMTRLLLKYERFILLNNDPGLMAVPTLDVDLAWHTHQLNPASYRRYTMEKIHNILDHHDKVTETDLNDAFARTTKMYEKKYGGKYSECTCWYPEAVRERKTSKISRIFLWKGKAALYDDKQDSKRCVHISTHNIVRPIDDTKDTTKA